MKLFQNSTEYNITSLSPNSRTARKKLQRDSANLLIVKCYFISCIASNKDVFGFGKMSRGISIFIPLKLHSCDVRGIIKVLLFDGMGLIDTQVRFPAETRE